MSKTAADFLSSPGIHGLVLDSPRSLPWYSGRGHDSHSVVYSCTCRQSFTFLLDRIEVDERLPSPLLIVSSCLTVLSLLRRCILALVLLLSSTSHAVGGRPTSTAATHPVTTPPKHSDQVQACPPRFVHSDAMSQLLQPLSCTP